MIKTSIDRIKKSRFFLITGAVLCSLLWGSAFPAIRTAHQYFDSEPLMNHIAFAGIRFTLAGVLVLVFTKNNLENFKRCRKSGLFAVALFQVVFQYILFYWGMKTAPAVLGAILVSTGSFWWVLLAPVFDKKETISMRQFAVLILGFTGVCICLINKSGGGDQSAYGLLFVFSSLCGIIAALMVRPMNKKMSISSLSGMSLFSGGLILCLISYSETIVMISSMPIELLVLTLWLALVSSAAFSLWYYLITIFDVPRLSGYRMLIPLFGVTESVIFLKDEKLTANLFIGGAVILASIWLLEKIKKTGKAKR